MGAEPIRASIHVEAPPERVFRYFTEPEAIVRWMGDTAALDPRPGGRFELDVGGAPVRGAYVALDPPHRVVVSWGYAGSSGLPPGASIVEVRLTAQGGGTLVELEHRDLPGAQRPGHEVGWAHYGARLRLAASGRDPGPDPGMPPAPAAGAGPQAAS